MTTNNFYFDNKKEHFPKLHISHIDYITVIKQMFPISLFYQLSMISTLGRHTYSPEQFRQIFTVYMFLCHIFVTYVFAFPELFHGFLSLDWVVVPPNYLTVQFIHSGEINQAQNRLISKMAAYNSQQKGEDRTEFDLIFKCSHHWTFIQQLNFF